MIYALAEQLPRSEDFNLKNQMTRAATSIALNIAEGSTGQSNAEQARFLGMAIRSLVETVACQHLIRRRGYCSEDTTLRSAYDFSEKLFAKLSAFRTRLKSNTLREEPADYDLDIPTQISCRLRSVVSRRLSAVIGRRSVRNVSRNDLATLAL